ncbi:hypothetical protein [Kineosporia sp. NBRC 101731]|uniref:hypothetical protein n=1 Tax=Kineosporia sp. NBRC 101731 TaxID=3032199 RepID=UPI0024A02012|nr:hypothetical protein [Kineosporia sp. NBRC 101731]GLY29502.1 hypothetical protein Kisp02_28670 [Kineosporia sp. NBRC 101731]
MPDTTTTVPRRLEELEVRPAPQLFARATALQLFTDEPEPVEDPGAGHGNSVDSGAGADTGWMASGPPAALSGTHDHEGAGASPGFEGPGRRMPTLRRCLAVAGVVAVLMTGAGLSAQALGPDDPAEPPAAPPSASTPETAPGTSLAGTTVGWGSAGLAVGGGMAARAYFGRLDDLVSELDGTVSFRIVPGYLESFPERCALTVIFTGVHGKEASAYAMDLGDSWPAPELAPSSKVSTDHGVVHHQMVMPPASVKAGTSWTYWSLIDVDGQQTNTGPYSLNLVKRDGSRLTWSFGGQTITCSVY